MSSSSDAIARLQAVMANIAARGSNAANGRPAGAPANMSASANTSRPAVPTSNDDKAASVAQPVVVAEDAVQDGGNAIDTFSSYVPTALPHCVLKALYDAHRHSDEKSTQHSIKEDKQQQQQEDVIVLLDSDDECEQNDTNKKEYPTSSLSTADYLSQLFTKNNALIQSHTSPACEAALLASVSACNFSSEGSDGALSDESASTILPLVVEGKLSPLQAEGVALATTRFNRVFTSKNGESVLQQSGAVQRAGFFLGDGAGIGKGRQIGATIRDAFCRNHGHGRHLWISTSRELVEDAKRDLRDVGCHVEVHDGVDLLGKSGTSAKGLGVGGSSGKGVLFITYSLLVSKKRLEDILNWLRGSSNGKNDSKHQAEQSYDGMIVFDEAHKAKNLEADTRTAKLVIALQERLPNSRVLYCSATGVSEIAHMAYAVRLGLWGSANPLYPTFDSFKDALTRRGVGAMEMLALEMKRKGLFLARTLSWEGADFHTVEVRLCEKQVASYDGAVKWWFKVKDEIESALRMLNIPSPKMIWRLFFAAQQRFYKEMCICAKVDEVVAQAKKYLDNDHSVVIGLQSTGEAGMEVTLNELAESLVDNGSACKDQKGKVDIENVDLPHLLSTCGSIMSNFLRNHFPIAHPPPEAPTIPPLPPDGFSSELERLEHARITDLAERIKSMPAPEPIRELVLRRERLLNSINDLDLPPNPLDDIIDRFGVDNVAEMTGRSGRILRKKDNIFRYTKRFGGTQTSYGLSMPINRDDESDCLNVKERKLFMDGKKHVAIISDAASTGVSLHSDRRCKSSHKRRVHFTIELPWAADKAIQQLGRSHRSGQVSAPIYKMVVTDLGGERRFASAVSKRMAQLGALTKGDRRAATGTDLSEFDVDSVFGRRTLAKFYMALFSSPCSPPSRNTNSILDEFISQSQQSSDDARMEMLTTAANALSHVGLGGEPNVKKFLNRIAGLEVLRQRLVFSLFMSTLDDVISDAKATGEFEGSVEDIKATSIELKSELIIATDSSCGAKTELTRLIIDRGVSFNFIVETIAAGSKQNGDAKFAVEEDADAMERKESHRKYAKSGFYLSKRKIAGRHLVLFAQQKVSDEVDNDFDDPLGLMVITRPNTGKNPCEMSSKDLRYKYDLLVSSEVIAQRISCVNNEESGADNEEKKSENDEPKTHDAISIVRDNWKNVACLWDEAYNKSNFMNHNDGLAPRISEIGLITGAVLHILPALEKAVQIMSSSQRSLRVMRVETDSGRRIVGIKFPVTPQAIERLMVNMSEVSSARQGLLSAFIDEPFSPISDNAMKFATTERKTMKSFFGAAASKPSFHHTEPLQPASKTKLPFTPVVSSTKEKKRKQESTAAQIKKVKKTSDISSFFGKKKDY
ncbi:hypothetical protein ACHAXM_009693 [Skeletonema potamos]